jgi:hypothetical protein
VHYLLFNLSASRTAVTVNDQPVPGRARLPARAKIEVFGQEFAFQVET